MKKPPCFAAKPNKKRNDALLLCYCSTNEKVRILGDIYIKAPLLKGVVRAKRSESSNLSSSAKNPYLRAFFIYLDF